MSTLENIRDIFSILHDGTIVSWAGDRHKLTLEVECLYLAKRLDASFDKFYIELKQITELQLSTWPNPIDRPARVLTGPADIFKADLEILSSEIKDNRVLLACNQADAKFDYCGGNVALNCYEIKISDQNKQEISINKLIEICKSYWDNFTKK